MLSKFERTLIEDPDNPGELLLDLGEEICAEMGWEIGDQLVWEQAGDGKWILKKITSQ